MDFPQTNHGRERLIGQKCAGSSLMTHNEEFLRSPRTDRADGWRLHFMNFLRNNTQIVLWKSCLKSSFMVMISCVFVLWWGSLMRSSPHEALQMMIAVLPLGMCSPVFSRRCHPHSSVEMFTASHLRSQVALKRTLTVFPLDAPCFRWAERHTRTHPVL